VSAARGSFRRFEEAKQVRNDLLDDLPQMVKIVEHRRMATPAAPSTSMRELKDCVQVELWVDADGCENLVVRGSENASHLMLKGLLHDGVYALAHAEEPGFLPT
jgi:hypothetical protein